MASVVKKVAVDVPSPLRGEGQGGGGSLTTYSRELRNNATDTEKKLWYRIKNKQLGHKFRRQHPIGAKYIADFICLEKNLIIELDGGQHAEQVEYDSKRTELLNVEGYRVLRFWNNEIFQNLDGVVETIFFYLENEKENPLNVGHPKI